MEKSFIVFRISWCVSGREHGIELHGNKCCVDHCYFRRTRVYVYTGKFYYCSGSIKVFILDFTFCITIKCISKISSKFFISKWAGPIPISSSGVNAMQRGPCGIVLSLRCSIIVIISAIPALSSAPRMVVPSEVIRVLPFNVER